MTAPAPFIEPDDPEVSEFDWPGWAIGVDRSTFGNTNIAADPIGYQRRWPQVWPPPCDRMSA